MKKDNFTSYTKTLFSGLLCLSLSFSPALAEKISVNDSISTRSSGIVYEKGTDTSKHQDIGVQFSVKEFLQKYTVTTPSERFSSWLSKQSALFNENPKDILDQLAKTHRDLYGENQLGTTFAGFQTVTAATSDAEVVALLQSELDKISQETKDILARRLAYMGDILTYYKVKEDSAHAVSFQIRTSIGNSFSSDFSLVNKKPMFEIWETYPVQSVPQELMKALKSCIKHKASKDQPYGILGYISQKKKYKAQDIIDQYQRQLPENLILSISSKLDYSFSKKSPVYAVYCLKKHNGAAAISGDIIEAASAISQNGNNYLLVKLNPAATKAFAQLTQSHLNQPIAICLDGKVLSMPTVHAAIQSGNFQIPVPEKLREITTLAALLNNPDFKISPINTKFKISFVF